MKKVVFSGIQPSGDLHIGNYIGAIAQWVKMQDEYDCIYCIVDLHAITVPQDPKTLREKILEVTALYLACGIDPQKSKIFIQSENPDHPYLAWVLNCITPFGQLERMTQFKDKSQTQKEGTTAGLFDYPVLMAADILLYHTDEVPVGEDQKQHIELTRDVAEKFNKTFGETFKLPNPHISKFADARIMSLQTPSSKMSKSDIDPLGTINLLDSEDRIREKIKKAVTDSEPSISAKVHGQGNGAVQNLLTIYAALSGCTYNTAVQKTQGKAYGQFKQELADLVVENLKPIQVKYKEIRNDEKYLRQVLDDGRNFAISKSSKLILEVKEKLGLV
ncbi:MAG: tryptophan--tRNA ligase [Candidatus Levybacteria bacterium CG_4_10_14_0_8_um_filter_35_23]|nr:MAG: tryptophan--tRNA ligase [Candidatus Levybacteria bacterium CG_4_10_14_0_8_um_filter_35_23]